MNSKARWYITRFNESSGGYAIIANPEVLYRQEGSAVVIQVPDHGIQLSASSIDEVDSAAAHIIRDQLAERFDYQDLAIAAIVDHRFIVAEPDCRSADALPYPSTSSDADQLSLF